MKKILLSFVAVVLSAMSYAQNVDFTQHEITTTASGYTLTVDGITLTADKAEGTNAPTQNGTSKDLRHYAKNTLQISSANGAISKIVFNISTAGKKRLTDITASAGEVAIDAEAWTVTWTGSASEITFTVGEKATYGTDGNTKAGQFNFNSAVFTGATASAPSLQMTYPQAGTTVTEMPDKIMFMFDQEITTIGAAAVQWGENDPEIIEATSVIDGNTVVLDITAIKSKITPGNVAAFVYVNNVEDFYETNFVLGATLGVKSVSFDSKGGQIVFDQNIDFVDYATEGTVDVYSAADEKVATANLTLDDDDYAALNVEFSKELAAGNYYLDFPEGIVMSTAEEPFSGKVEFEVAAKATPLATWTATASDDYPASWGYDNDIVLSGYDCTIEQYEDKCVVRGWDGAQGDDIEFVPNGSTVSSINGDTGNWSDMWMHTDKYYYGSLYIPYTYIYGLGETNGCILVSGYFYKDYNDAGTWGSVYLSWGNFIVTGINDVNTTTNSDVMYNLSGQRVNANAKGIVIKNGKKVIIK